MAKKLIDTEGLSRFAGKVVGKINSVDTAKQAKLVSGRNIKKINGIDLLGEGNIEIASEGGSDIMMDGDMMKVKIGEDYYVINGAQKLIKPATPTLPASQSYNGGGSVNATCATAGVTMYYTTDGSEPTTSSTKYVSGISLAQVSSEQRHTYVVKVIAVLNGEKSDIAEQTYYVYRKLSAPVISVNAGSDEYSTVREITITHGTTGAEIKYTKDGTDPTTSLSNITYEETFSITSTSTIKAYVNKQDWVDSAVASQSYTVGTLLMYKGVVDNAPTTESEIKAMSPVKQKTFPLDFSINVSGQKKVCIAYDKSYGNLTSIKDANGTEYLGDYTRTVVGSYNVYCMNKAGDQNGMSYSFRK